MGNQTGFELVSSDFEENFKGVELCSGIDAFRKWE